MSSDPNKDRNDPMAPEYWLLGEDLQDKIRAAGYDSPTVEGIAVDIHDLLQAATRIQQELAPAIVGASVEDKVELLELLTELKFEFDHVRWHCGAASAYLDTAIKSVQAL